MPPNRDTRLEALAELTSDDFRKVRAVMRRIEQGEAVQIVVADLVKKLGAAAASAEHLEKILTDLLKAPPTLHHLEAVRQEGEGPPMAVIPTGAAPRQVPIHPSVDLEALRDLKPWEYVAVNPEQNVVIGTWSDDPSLWARQQGEVVEFKAYCQEGAKGSALVNRPGRGSQVVELAPELREAELTAGSQLVLQRDNDRWAIGLVPAEHAQSKYEIPIESLESSLDDLAGLDSIAEKLLEKILVRAVFPEIRDEFALEPLRGVLLYSNKPGQGKTALVRALARETHELGKKRDFDLVLYSVKPNALKSKWHGEDSSNVRELGANIRARCAKQDPARRLILWVLFDEVESLGTRMGHDEGLLSSAQNDVVQSLLAELDGLIRDPSQGGDGAVVCFFGLTNRLDMLDPALRRPGRLGDLVLGIPDYTIEGAEGIMWKYCRKESIPWYLDGEVQTCLPEETVRRRFLRPALARVFDSKVLDYSTEGQGQRRVEVTAGEVMAGANFWNAIKAAKELGSVRKVRGRGVPAVSCDDLLFTLIEESRSAAAQLVADRTMLRRVLDVKTPILNAGLAPADDQQEHRYLRSHTG